MSLSSAASAQPPNEEWKKSTNPVDHCEIVSKLANGNSYKCKYCAKQFNGSATRCYVHLTGEGIGVAKCTKCPKETVLSLTAEQAKKKAQGSKKRKESEADQCRRDSHAEAGPGPSSAAAAGRAGSIPGPVSHCYS